MAPLSKFQQLAQLCSDPEDVNRLFSMYNIIAVLIHDGDTCSVREAVRREFVRLHWATGPHFAVISFIGPPKDLMRKYRSVGDMQKYLMYGSNMEDNDEVFLDVLQRRLCLPSLPALLLTSSLMSDSYTVITPRENTIVDLLTMIGSLAQDRKEPVNADDKALLALLSQFGQPETFRTEDGESLAKNMADMTAISAMNGEGYDFDKYYDSTREKAAAIEWVKNTLAQLKDKMLSMVSSNADPEEISHASERFYDYRYYALHARDLARTSMTWDKNIEYGLSRHRSRPFLPDPLEKWYKYDINYYLFNLEPFRDCEKETQRILRQYIELNLMKAAFKDRLYDKDRSYDRDYRDFEWLYNDYCSQDDFSNEVSCLGKMIEQEVNASVVQLIRRDYFDIDMPEFYMRYCPEARECNIWTRERTIYFNHPDNGMNSLKSIPLGEVNTAVRKLLRDNNRDTTTIINLGPLASEDYISLISRFTNLRNYAAHPGAPITQDKFQEMLTTFRAITNRYLKNYIHIKKMLKTPSIETEP